MNADAQPVSRTDSLSQDLRMVLSRELPMHDESAPQAAIHGKSVSIESAEKTAAGHLQSSIAPAIVGLGGLSIEAMGQAVVLAEKLRGKLLPYPSPDPVQSRQRVSFHAGLAEAVGADLRLVANESTAADDALASVSLAVDERVPNALFMAVADLDAVLRLRQALATDGVHAIRKLTSLPVNHAVVMLPPTVDPRVVSQWHLLAAKLQATLRMSVVTVPYADGGNQRGVVEVIAMKIGLHAWAGGIDFATGIAAPCAGYATHIEQNACDVLIDTGLNPSTDRSTIRISQDVDDANRCDVWLRGGLARGIAARVMRFDGSMLWLCDDPKSSPADPTVKLLQRLGGTL